MQMCIAFFATIFKFCGDIQLSLQKRPHSSWLLSILQCFQKRYTSEFWRICCNFSTMKRFVCGVNRILLFSLSANAVDSSWRSCNIFFKILRYTSSENTVVQCCNFWKKNKHSLQTCAARTKVITKVYNRDQCYFIKSLSGTKFLYFLKVILITNR